MLKSSKKNNDFLSLFIKNKIGVIGFCGVIVIVILALLAPLYSKTPSGFGALNDVLLKPSKQYIFGTDIMGLDILSQILWGARTSLKVGFTVIFYVTIIGVPIGILSGYYGGKVDDFFMGITDIFLTLPVLPLTIVISAVLGSSILKTSFIIGILSWPRMAKITRASTLETIRMPYIEAAKSLGIPSYVILFKHILLSISSYIIVEMTMVMIMAVLTESSLSFLGLGDINVWSWGKIIQNAHSNGVFLTAWWCSLFPSIAITVFVLSFTFLGLGVRDTVNSN